MQLNYISTISCYIEHPLWPTLNVPSQNHSFSDISVSNWAFVVHMMIRASLLLMSPMSSRFDAFACIHGLSKSWKIEGGSAGLVRFRARWMARSTRCRFGARSTRTAGSGGAFRMAPSRMTLVGSPILATASSLARANTYRHVWYVSKVIIPLGAVHTRIIVQIIRDGMLSSAV